MNKNIKQTPPHLPPKSCSVSTHQTFNFFSWIFVVLVLSSLAGMAASLSSMAWLSPTLSREQVLFVGGSEKKPETIGPILLQQIKQRVVSIYDTRKKIDNIFYTSGSLVNQGIMVSSDGWGALYRPNYAFGEENYWEGVAYQGNVYKIEKTIFNSNTGILYFKFAGDGFRIITFTENDNYKKGDVVWALTPSGLRDVVLDDKQLFRNKKTFPIWESQYAYLKNTELSIGAPLFSLQGDYLGFFGEVGMVEAWQIEEQIAPILSLGKILPESLDIEGFLVEGYFENGVWKNIDGFYITALGRFSLRENSLKVGDLIIKIQGSSVDKYNLARQIFVAGDEFSASILRNGVQQDITVKKILQ